MSTPSGFVGLRGRVLATVAHVGHRITVAEYLFKDGARVPFVEVSEDHDDARPATIRPLTEVVHLLQNVRDDEFWEIAAGREGLTEGNA